MLPELRSARDARLWSSPGKAIGFAEFGSARQGKRFELEVEGEVTDDVLARAREAATTLLSNPVIEDVVRVEARPDVGAAPQSVVEIPG